ncbi:MAG: hypothetical protein JNJ57_00325 [Saprospiraceae bacterium]|nr:hypothetical protein [Saprospiraceae bacterium]
MKAHSLLKLVVLFSIYLLVGTAGRLEAQDASLLTDLRMSQASLTTSQNDAYQKFVNSGGYVSTETKFTQIGNLASVAASGNVRIAIGGTDISFAAYDVSYNSEQDYSWYGRSAGGDDLLLVSKDGSRIGSATIGSEQYELLGLGSDVFAWMRINKESFSRYDCGVPDGSPSGPDGESGELADQTCRARILVLYTAAAKAATPDMTARINLAISQTNQALGNSQVPTSALRVELAHHQQFNFTESGNMQADVSALANNASAQALRNQHFADIVVLITNGNYGGTLGIVKAIGPSNNDAYTIVQTNAATSAYFTFSHEVAHLFGCRHNNDPNGTYEHGHNFNAGGLKKTIMNVLYEPEGGSRILHYSNPDVKYQNVPTGVPNQRNNALKLKNTGCTVSGFRGEPGPPPFQAHILNGYWGCACAVKILQAGVTGGSAPFQYEWRTSVNGINWSPVLGTGQTFTVTLPCIETAQYWVKLRVISSNGQVTETSRRIFVVQC